MEKQSLFSLHREFRTGGKIEIMNGYEKKADHNDLFSISRFFAQKGDNVKITTEVHFKDKKYKQVFGALIGTKHDRKCPDLIISGIFYEYESYTPPFKVEKISNMLSRGLKQSSCIILNNNKGSTHRTIKKNIHNRITNEKQIIDEVWVYEKGKVFLLYKKQ